MIDPYQEEREHLDRLIAIPDAPMRRTLHRGDSLPMKDPEFIWPNWITKHAFNLITGDPGAGKSTVIADLVARMTADHATWPDGEPITTGPINVALINLEDPPDQMLLPRVAAAGGNVSRVWVAPEGIVMYDDAGLGWLERECHQHKIDVVLSDQMSMGFDPRASMYDYAAMYREGARVNHWCRRNNRTAIMAHHHKKGKGDTLIERVAGTNGLSAVARTVLQVYVPARKHDDRNRYLGVTKPNPDADLPGALPFQTVKSQIQQRKRFVWLVDWQEQLDDSLEALYGQHSDTEAVADTPRSVKVPVIQAYIIQQLTDDKAAGLGGKLIINGPARTRMQREFGCSERTLDRALSTLAGVTRNVIPNVGIMLELNP